MKKRRLPTFVAQETRSRYYYIINERRVEPFDANKRRFFRLFPDGGDASSPFLFEPPRFPLSLIYCRNAANPPLRRQRF